MARYTRTDDQRRADDDQIRRGQDQAKRLAQRLSKLATPTIKSLADEEAEIGA